MLYTTAMVSRELGVTPRRVRAIAESRKVGSLLSPRVLVFTEEEVNLMRKRLRPWQAKKPGA